MEMQYMLTTKIIPLWLKFVLPAIVGVVLNTIYIMVDGIFVGQGTGEAGLAGVNLAWPAVTIILGIGLMLGAGTTIVVSKSLGESDKDKAERTLATIVKFIVLIGAVLSVVGFMFATPITNFLGATEDTFGYTQDYFVVVYFMAIPYLFSNTLTLLVRADGNPNLSMIMVGAGAIGNIVLDWLFVLVLGLGTRGAALATGCGVILSTTIGLWYFIKGPSNLKLKKEYFIFDTSILKEVCKIGAASLFIQLSTGIIILVQNHLLYIYGSTDYVAIFCVSGYIWALYNSICLGIGQGIQPVLAFHFGANSHERLKSLVKFTMLVSVSLGLLFLAGLFFFGEHLIGLYGISDNIMQLAYELTFIFCFGSPVLGIVHTMTCYYQATNKSSYANIISIGRGTVLQTTFAIVLSYLYGAIGVFFAQASADILAIFIVGVLALIEKKGGR
ncbi:MAG: MATE family efflux transporter [Epulopiscium sp. Nele67-Bin004]|nr:MAG: MATE family efflux transporter [Epulopiscium sp. Nele67-Bin004]